MGGRGRKKELPLQTEQIFAHRRSHARSEKRGAFAKKKGFSRGGGISAQGDKFDLRREGEFFLLPLLQIGS